MNQTAKYIGLLAILPLVALAMLPDYIGNADAEKADGSQGIQPSKFYGKATQDIVCGGALCSDAAPSATPIV